MGHKQALLREHARRLREMMALWWSGWSSGRIAKAHGITQQRAHQILASVGCTARLRSECSWSPAADKRHANRNEVIEAQVIMESAAWQNLTVRQRAVVAWLASGLGTVAIAARTGGTPQSVRNLFIAARWRVMGRRVPKSDDLGRVDDVQFDVFLERVNNNLVEVPAGEIAMPTQPVVATPATSTESETKAVPMQVARESIEDQMQEVVPGEPEAQPDDDADDAGPVDSAAEETEPEEVLPAGEPMPVQEPAQRMRLSEMQRVKRGHLFQ